MKVHPLVSVILSTKNESRNIEKFLKSVKNQSYKNLELIVVDNNSSDNTKLIAKRYTNKVFDCGPERSAQRNYGAKKSKGDYLLFLDADMELSDKVISDCIDVSTQTGIGILTIPEMTIGDGFLPKIRKFEREMYIGDSNYEVARFFRRNTFFEYKGYDEKLTGPEDYDLPYRMSKKNKIGRVTSFIYHNEEGLTLSRLLNKKYYYAKNGAYFAIKHPQLVKIQGTILFRKVYFKNFRHSFN